MFKKTERRKRMNMDDADLLDPVTASLEQQGLVLRRLEPKRTSAVPQSRELIRVAKGNASVDYLVKAKRGVTQATLGPLLAQLNDRAKESGFRVLLVADYLTPPVAERLRLASQPFADTAGNAYIDGPNLLVSISGRRRLEEQPDNPASQASTSSGLKLLFALLTAPGLAEGPQRQMAAAAGVALGSVPGILNDLQRGGHLLAAGKHRRLRPTKRLLDEWAYDYARRLRPKSLLAAYVTPKFSNWAHWPMTSNQPLWGGEPAANLLVGNLKPGVLTLYAETIPVRLVVAQRMTSARPVDVEHRVEIRKLFWGPQFFAEQSARTVPPALVYADLLATGDARCFEAAGLIYDRHLAELLPAA